MFKEIFRKFKPDNSTKYGWFGNYESWAEVIAQADGYDSGIILQRTKNALLKVKNGEALYERDSVILDKKVYPFPLLSFLLHSAAIKGRPLNVLDFGGSLGSTFFQIKSFLTPNVCQSWNVIEQSHYVESGKAHFEDDQLKFYYNIASCLKDKEIDFVLISSSVQYLEEPHLFLKELADYDFDFLLFDRTAFHHEANDRLTIQHVPPDIYEASYPSWFFNEEKFLNHFLYKYNIVADFASYVEGESVLLIDEIPVGYGKGFYLTRL
jgi:putative methyltransferase (TIGR04325 family)